VVLEPLEQLNNDPDYNSQALGQLIRQRITESPCCRMTFAEFMELALYHPHYGYYATGPSKIGRTGDFFTSPHLGSDFGEMVAEQLVQMWRALDQPNPFTLVEMGAGQGILAKDILNYVKRTVPALFNCLEYRIVEKSAVLIAQQKHHLEAFQLQGLAIAWGALEEIPLNSVVGCFFSNELVDALPVHQIVLESGSLKEVYVSVDAGDRGNGPLSEVLGELSTPRLGNYFDLIGLRLTAPPYPDRYRSEVNLAALDWMATVAERLQRGYVLTIDYGYPSDRYYHPARAEGTLQCYYRHAHHSSPYQYLGRQDITAHVNFTALQKQGEKFGLQTLGLTKQGLFLMALGLGDRIAALSQTHATTSIQAVLHRREALHTLINPMGLGNFGVLIQGKQVSYQAPLRGLLGEF
jgi:SAM-dependent MidA family methyltransferase